MSQLDLDDPELLERVAMLKTQAKVALVGSQPARGNPAFDEARKIGLEKRRKKLIVYTIELISVFQKMKEKGARTLQEVADMLNAEGIKPRKAKKWTLALVSNVLRSARVHNVDLTGLKDAS